MKKQFFSLFLFFFSFSQIWHFRTEKGAPDLNGPIRRRHLDDSHLKRLALEVNVTEWVGLKYLIQVNLFLTESRVSFIRGFFDRLLLVERWKQGWASNRKVSVHLFKSSRLFKTELFVCSFVHSVQKFNCSFVQKFTNFQWTIVRLFKSSRTIDEQLFTCSKVREF